MVSRALRRIVFAVVFSLFAGAPAGSLGQTWSNLTVAPAEQPPARRYASALYDPMGHRMIIFAGQGASGVLNDVWALDLNSLAWTELTPQAGPAPSPRRTPGSVYDPTGHRMITWSGQGGGFFNDAWGFDLSTSTWTQFAPSAPLPNPRYGVASVYDPLSGELVSFAGFTNQGRFDDTWRFDPLTENWTDVSPANLQPTQRCLHSASYDSRGHRMIMYGGQQSGPLDDIWAFDLDTDTWADLSPANRPSGRFHAAHVYDSRNHRATIFGGNRGASGGLSNEVWLFDLTFERFSQMSPSESPPSPREGSAAIYIEAEDRMLIFGGHDGSAYLDEVWSIEELSQTATSTPSVTATGRPLLEQNHPNPFNPSTTIRFDLPRDGHVTLDIHDAAGRFVIRLLDGPREAGPGAVSWNGRDQRGARLSSGIYYYRLRHGSELDMRKMVLVE